MTKAFFVTSAIAIAAITTTVASAMPLRRASHRHLIVGGKEVPVGQRPYMVGLRAEPGIGINCGGSLITAKHVLTAAHCVAGPQEDLHVVIGTRAANGTKDGVEARVTKTTIHPQYNANNGSYSYDYAILELKQNVDTTKFPPIRIMGPSCEDPTPGTVLTTLGWGLTAENASSSDVLLQVDVPIVTNAECAKTIDKLDRSMLCAGGQKDLDACNGDSGGPLVVKQGDADVLVGIVSWGKDDTCGRAGIPGIYSRVSVGAEWVQSIVKDVSVRSCQQRAACP